MPTFTSALISLFFCVCGGVQRNLATIPTDLTGPSVCTFDHLSLPLQCPYFLSLPFLSLSLEMMYVLRLFTRRVYRLAPVLWRPRR